MSTLTVQTLQAPTSGANANKLLVGSGHTLHAAGHVIQTQTLSRVRTARQTISSTSYVAVNDGVGAFQLAITPKFSSSKIIGMFTIGGIATTTNATSIGFSIYRNGSEIQSLDSHFGYNYDEDGDRHIFSPVFVDAPSSTSTCTYAIYSRISNSSQTAYIFDTHFRSDNTSTFILQEVAQ